MADELDFDDALEGADLVVTGEGFVDAQSFEGKVVGGVAERAAAAGVPMLVVAGEVYDDAGTRVEAVSLVERFGEERARRDPAACVEEVVRDRLETLRSSRLARVASDLAFLPMIQPTTATARITTTASLTRPKRNPMTAEINQSAASTTAIATRAYHHSGVDGRSTSATSRRLPTAIDHEAGRRSSRRGRVLLRLLAQVDAVTQVDAADRAHGACHDFQ